MQEIFSYGTTIVSGGIRDQAIIVCLALVGISLIIVGFEYIKRLFNREGSRDNEGFTNDERDRY